MKFLCLIFFIEKKTNIQNQEYELHGIKDILFKVNTIDLSLFENFTRSFSPSDSGDAQPIWLKILIISCIFETRTWSFK